MIQGQRVEIASYQQVDYSYGLGLAEIIPSLDIRNPDNCLEFRLHLRNDVTDAPLRFFVDKIEYTIEGKTVSAAAASPATLAKGGTLVFFPNAGFSRKDYNSFKMRTTGLLQYTIRYGAPNGNYTRSTSKAFDLQIFKQPKQQLAVNWTVRTESDSQI